MQEAYLERTVDVNYEPTEILVDRRRREEEKKILEVTIDKTIDARGAYCPEPLMALIEFMKHEPAGSVIEVLSSVQGSAKEIPYWANKVGHDHLGTEVRDDFWSILVKKN
jgi:tRNA 2-thiouridine synthesizing protein A